MPEYAVPETGLTPNGGGEDLGPDETFTISQLAAAFAITPRTIRFYESKGLLTPRRQGRNRVYSRRDRVRLILILRGKRVGFSLDEIQEMLDLYDLRGGQETQIRHALTKCDQRIGALEAQRRDIDDALAQLRSGKSAMLDLLARQSARPDRPALTSFAVADTPSTVGQTIDWTSGGDDGAGDDESDDEHSAFLAPEAFLVKDS
ncbi:MAG: MerR family DNA-binding transcriptional regulator [Alphaproteobacteria bacterium]